MTKSGHFPSLVPLDIRLIEELELDVRQTYKDLAAKLEVSILLDLRVSSAMGRIQLMTDRRSVMSSAFLPKALASASRGVR